MIEALLLIGLVPVALFLLAYLHSWLKLRRLGYLCVEDPPLYLINLPQSSARFERVQTMFEKLGLPRPERVPGVDGSRFKGETGGWAPGVRERFVAEGVLTERARLTPGQLGCALAHLAVWRRIVAEDVDWAVIFEDDIDIVNPEARTDLFRRFDSIPAGADVVFLHRRYWALPPRVLPFLRGKRVPFKGCGNEGYLISRVGAQKAIDIVTPLYTTKDVQLGHYFNNLKFVDQTCFFTKAKRTKLNAYLLDTPIVVENDRGVSEMDIIDGIYERGPEERP
ncbi:MAG: glycosyltransferase family 25 protein [bacterium]